MFKYLYWISCPCHYTLAVIFPQRSQDHKSSLAFITNTRVITRVWTQCGSTPIWLVLRADKKNTAREKLWYSFQLGQFILAVIYHSRHSFPLWDETRALNLMLYNLAWPPVEPCLKIVKKWMGQKKRKEPFWYNCFIIFPSTYESFSHTENIYVLKIHIYLTTRNFFLLGTTLIHPSIPPSSQCEQCNLCTWPLVLF